MGSINDITMTAFLCIGDLELEIVADNRGEVIKKARAILKLWKEAGRDGDCVTVDVFQAKGTSFLKGNGFDVYEDRIED